MADYYSIATAEEPVPCSERSWLNSPRRLTLSLISASSIRSAQTLRTAIFTRLKVALRSIHTGRKVLPSVTYTYT
jgi:hypothetical protein